jgi:glycosyltransferase involved in cell wall biosynthesis
MTQQGEPRLRIAVLSRVFARRGGGAESYAVHLVEELAARHEVHVFAQTIAHEWPGVHYHPVKVALRRPRWVNQIGFSWATRRATRSGFDIVHSHENTWHGDVHSIHVKSVRHNLLGAASGLARGWRWLKVALSPRLATYVWLEGARFAPGPGKQVVLASEGLRPQATAAYPDAEGSFSVVTPGVSMPTHGLGRAEARARLGLGGEGGPVLLFVANDYERKGLATLLDALVQLPVATLLVVGQRKKEAVFTTQAQRLGLSDRVRFLGPQDDLSPAYRAADVLVHPTREDSFAMVVLEAMAHELPVVVSGGRWCGISDLLRDGQEAVLLADPMDADLLAARVREVLADAPLQARLRSGGLEFAQRHGWAAAARAYEQIFARSLAGRGITPRS